ncbi:VWA domain-containing protein [Planctomycetaceae bacterium SH139]
MLAVALGWEHPWFLLLLGLLPLLWWTSFRSLAGLGSLRRILALLLRSVVVIGVVLALAGIQLVWTSDRISVVYLLDQSESIPTAKRQLMLDYVIKSVARHRNERREDKAGIIVFGREATIEIPPFDDQIPSLSRLESYLGRTDATNLEAALKLAQAAMPADTSRRIVIVSDGNENLGSARQLVARLADAGIGIDVVPVPLTADAEVLLEKIDLPSDIRKGQPFEARIVLNNYAVEGRESPVRGRLRVTQSLGNDTQLLSEEAIELVPGKNVFPLRHTIDQPAPYTYEAEFIPDAADDDSLQQNNRATSYTYVRGSGRVLLIEDWMAEPGQYDLLVDRLRQADIEVVIQPSNQLFTSLAELQAYDAVILAGVQRVSGDTADSISSFTDEQLDMLVRNTQQLGCGLLMIGGPRALGNGGWADTELEAAMPVNFRIRNSKVQAVGALAMIMHASEMAQGNYWQKVVARKAIEAMGPLDYCGVLHWNFSGDAWLWGGQQGMLPVGNNQRAMLAAVGRMTPGDMPQFDPAMRMAVKGLNNTNASLKHCIIISDGDPSDPTPATIQAFKDNGITISTVAVATHGPAESQRLRQIAITTGGKYYAAQNAQALPKIFQREARKVSQPLNFEPEGGVEPQVIYPHPIVEGIGVTLPNTKGFVQTEVKDSPLVQVLVRSPLPLEPDNATILAVWNYGLGRTAVLTTDAGSVWAEPWTRWSGYDKFFSQLVRWLMRPSGDTGNFTMATKAENGRIEVVVTALDQNEEFLDFLEMNASALSPDLQPIPLTFRQTAPGRYVGSIPADQAGSYFLNVVPTAGESPLTTGVTVPFSEEFRVREANEALLQALAGVEPSGGTAGVISTPLSANQLEEVLATDTFRGGLALARSARDAWPFVILCVGCLFLADVAVRRITIDWSRIGTLVNAGRSGRNASGEQTQSRLESLKAQKEKVGDSIERRRSSARYQPTDVADADQILNSGDSASQGGSQTTRKTPSLKAEQVEKSYTERLLEAKRRAQKDNRDNQS